MRLELRKSQDYRGRCEAERTPTSLGQQPIFHQSLPPTGSKSLYAGECEKDPDKIRTEKWGDNKAMPRGANLVVGVITKSTVTANYQIKSYRINNTLSQTYKTKNTSADKTQNMSISVYFFTC